METAEIERLEVLEEKKNNELLGKSEFSEELRWKTTINDNGERHGECTVPQLPYSGGEKVKVKMRKLKKIFENYFLFCLFGKCEKKLHLNRIYVVKWMGIQFTFPSLHSSRQNNKKKTVSMRFVADWNNRRSMGNWVK